MKACPTCKRTYADETLSYCLVDGSILSAPYDPHDTVRIHAPRATDPAPTEIMNPAPRPPDLKPSTLSTIQAPAPPPLYAGKQQAPANEKQSGKPWMAIGIGMSLFLIIAVGAIMSFIWLGQDSSADNHPPPKDPNINVKPTVTPTAMPTATPTATVGDGGWGPRNEQAGLTGERLTYYPGTTPEKCQADCDGDPRCSAYTYIRAGHYNPNDPPMCYLMSVAHDFTPSPCCISAIKR